MSSPGPARAGDSHDAARLADGAAGSPGGGEGAGATRGHPGTRVFWLLQAVSPWDEATLHRGLHQLVAAEFLYQQGLPPQATYRFKHALIQEAAYQSLLRSTRQRTICTLPRCWRHAFPRSV